MQSHQQGLMIRPAVDSDCPHIWPTYEQIVSAGETYAYPEPPVMEVARSLWMEQAPVQTVVAVEDGSVLGAAKMGRKRSVVAAALLPCCPGAS